MCVCVCVFCLGSDTFLNPDSDQNVQLGFSLAGGGQCCGGGRVLVMVFLLCLYLCGNEILSKNFLHFSSHIGEGIGGQLRTHVCMCVCGHV